MPIGIYISNSPASTVTVDLLITNGVDKVVVNPTSLEFKPDENVKYFRIEVEADYNGTGSESVTFAISGADADIYDIDSP